MINRENAILVRVRLSAITTGKADSDATKKVNEEFKSESNAGVYIKKLLTREDTGEIFSVLSSIYAVKKMYSLPWTDGNIRVLPAKAFEAFAKETQAHIDRLNTAIQSLVANYDKVKASAKKRLGDLYREEEFPSKETIKKAFGVKISYFPIPEKQDFRTANPEVVQSFENDMSEQLELAKREIWERFKDTIGHLSERLKKSDNIFRESTVKKISELVKLAKVLNMDDDQHIEAFRQEVEAKLTGFTGEDLRKDDKLRAKKAKETKELLKKLDNYL